MVDFDSRRPLETWEPVSGWHTAWRVRGLPGKPPVELPFKHGPGLTGLGIKNMECDKV